MYMQLFNSHSKDKSGIWETNMLIQGTEQYLAGVSTLCLGWVPPITSLSQRGRLMRKWMLKKPNDLPKAI